MLPSGPATHCLSRVTSSPPSYRPSPKLDLVTYHPRAALVRSIQPPRLSRAWTYPPPAQSLQVLRPAVIAESTTGYDRALAYTAPLSAATQPTSSTGAQETHSSSQATHSLSGVSSSPPSSDIHPGDVVINIGTPTPPLNATTQPATSTGVQEIHNLPEVPSPPPSTHSNIHHGDVVTNRRTPSNSDNHEAGARLSLEKMLLSLKNMSPILKYFLQLIFLSLTCVGVWYSAQSLAASKKGSSG